MGMRSPNCASTIPNRFDPPAAKLADAQLVLARSYRASSWTRLVHAVQLADAIWRDDPDGVLELITRNRALIHEDVLIRTDSNWGPPMTYAANLGRDGIIRLLHRHGAIRRFSRRSFPSATSGQLRQGTPDERLSAAAPGWAPIRASVHRSASPGGGTWGRTARDIPRDVTPLGWGNDTTRKIFVSRESLRLIEERGGGR